MSESESTAIEPVKSNVPDLVRTPALEISAEDVALPRLKLGQYMSSFVQEGDVAAGDLFTSLGKDDPDPQTVYSVGDDKPLRIHVLNMTRGKSVSEGGELYTYSYDDPDAPEDAWVTYDYVIVLPEFDAEVPAKWLLTRTGRPAAQQMNMVLARNAAKGPIHELAFDVTAAARENDKGKYFIPRIRHVEADADHVEIAAKLAAMITPDQATVNASNDEPEI